ncbi:hypothetical protein [Parachlamydia sp. AcF125]|uniref:hypothetical protein n=1 Tax=Parachlamydia sp. AcF125 TaxID=2795736 RepID=UPI002015F40A|nr:hypothetical protein [Parachlamydia sp. AcF125]
MMKPNGALPLMVVYPHLGFNVKEELFTSTTQGMISLQSLQPTKHHGSVKPSICLGT